MRHALRSLALAHTLLAATAALGQTAHPAATRPAITGIAFFRAYTTHPAEAETFYGPTMGFPEIKAPGGTLVFPVNRSQWIEVLTAPPPQPELRLAAVAFTTRDVHALQSYLNAQGVPTAEPLHDNQFAVRDPEGNLVVFAESPYPTAAGDKSLTGTPKLVAAAQPLPSATSRRIIHVGFLVADRQKEDAFWRGILGFRPYWHGSGKTPYTTDDYVSLQVPDGTDWLEYMLNQPHPDLRLAGVMNHFSLGTERMQTVLAQLQANGCEGKNCTAIQAGVDGKVQLNLFDPDLTRIEYMEFTNAMKPCCSAFTGPMPGPRENQ